MRPLIEILEDERNTAHKIDSVCHFIVRNNDPEALGIMYTKKESLEQDLESIRQELKEYLVELLN